MLKLYDEHGLRMTRYGAYTSRKKDEERVAVLRETHGERLANIPDAGLIDAFELWILSDAHQDWLNQQGDSFIRWLDSYPIVLTKGTADAKPGTNIDSSVAQE